MLLCAVRAASLADLHTKFLKKFLFGKPEMVREVYYSKPASVELQKIILQIGHSKMG